MATLYLPDELKKRLIAAAIEAGYEVSRGAHSELIDFVKALLDGPRVDRVRGDTPAELWATFYPQIAPFVHQLSASLMQYDIFLAVDFDAAEGCLTLEQAPYREKETDQPAEETPARLPVLAALFREAGGPDLLQLDTTRLLNASLPPVAEAEEWQIHPAAEGWETLEFIAWRQTGAANVKSSFASVVLSEFLWYRTALALSLPAAPVQLLHMPAPFVLDMSPDQYGSLLSLLVGEQFDFPFPAGPDEARPQPAAPLDDKLGLPTAALIHLIHPSRDASGLWNAPPESVQDAGIAPETVYWLQGLAIWAGGPDRARFRVAGQKPYLVDTEGLFWLNPLGVPTDPNWDRTRSMLDRTISSREQAAEMLTFWRNLQARESQIIASCTDDLPPEMSGRLVMPILRADREKLEHVGQLIVEELRDHIARLIAGWTPKLIEYVQSQWK